MSDLIPDGWDEISIGDIGMVVTGFTPSTKQPEYWNGDIPFVSPADFNGQVYVNITSRTLSELGVGKARLLPSNSILVTCIGSLGGIAMTTKSSVTNQQINAVVASSKEFSKYHFYNILFNISQLEKNAGTTTLPIINKSTFEKIRVLRAPLPEQQKIAAILTSVDEVIEKTQAQIDKLKDLKTGMMQTLLTKGVGIDGKPHTAFKDSSVGRIPKGWKVLPLADVVERIIDCEHRTAPYVEKSEYIVVRTSNVRNGQLVLEDMKFTHADGYAEWTKRAVPSSGDVMFTREAPAGESCLVPDNLNVCLGQRMVLLRPNTEVILPCFFSLFLTSASAVKSIYELSIGTTVSRINIEDIKKIPCVLPSLAEQLKISNSIQSVQILLNAKRSKLKSVNKTKKALMQDLLTGKVRVTVPSETAGH